MNNQVSIYQSLLHRLDMIQTLLQDGERHRYLLPEILVKTVRDSYRLYSEGLAYLNAKEIFEQFAIDLTEDESALLIRMENSLRKSEEYEEVSKVCSLQLIDSFSQKLLRYLQNHKIEG